MTIGGIPLPISISCMSCPIVVQHIDATNDRSTMAAKFNLGDENSRRDICVWETEAHFLVTSYSPTYTSSQKAMEYNFAEFAVMLDLNFTLLTISAVNYKIFEYLEVCFIECLIKTSALIPIRQKEYPFLIRVSADSRILPIFKERKGYDASKYIVKSLDDGKERSYTMRRPISRTKQPIFQSLPGVPLNSDITGSNNLVKYSYCCCTK